MNNRIATLQEILPYVREFLGKTFVVKMGGEVCSEKFLPGIANQLSLIHHMGIRIVLVHGGGPQMDQFLARSGIDGKMVGGRRITDMATLNAAKMIYAGLISTDIVCELRAAGASAVGLSGADAGLITAVKRAPQHLAGPDGRQQLVDYQYVGDIESVNLAIIELLFERHIMPVVSSIGADSNGQALNINADTIAASLAQELRAAKFILLSNVPGVLRDKSDPASLVSYAGIERLQSMIENGQISDGMLPKIDACIRALRGGVPRTHIIDGTRAGSLLLELFLNEGCGTMIVKQEQDKG